MQKGAFALLDCLGFKGIWRSRNISPDELLSFMAATKNSSDDFLQVGRIIKGIHGDQVELKIAFISDSVIISAQFNSSRDPASSDIGYGYLVGVVVNACVDVQKRFLQAPTPLAFRGCIAFGEHAVLDSFYAGPAVDEAASLAEIGQGGFIWLTPDASEALDRHMQSSEQEVRQISSIENVDLQLLFADEIIRRIGAIVPANVSAHLSNSWNSLPREQKLAATPHLTTFFSAVNNFSGTLADYPMPVRTGGTLRSCIVNPYMKHQPPQFAAVTKLFLSSFDASSVDVLMKRQNTETFLKLAAKDAEERIQTAYKAIVGAVAVLDKILPAPAIPAGQKK